MVPVVPFQLLLYAAWLADKAVSHQPTGPKVRLNLVDHEAVRNAGAYTHLGIELAHPFGSGHGPLNHMHSLMQRTVPK